MLDFGPGDGSNPKGCTIDLYFYHPRLQADPIAQGFWNDQSTGTIDGSTHGTQATNVLARTVPADVVVGGVSVVRPRPYRCR